MELVIIDKILFFTYILKSLGYNKFYIGQTDNLSRRLKEHNSGNSIYTKRYKSWKVVYYEVFKTKEEAVERERYLKSAAGRRWLKNK